MSILVPPPSDAPQSVFISYHNMIVNAAKPSTLLTIQAGCINDPTVMKVKMNTNFMLYNKDTTEHLIVFDGNHRYSLQPETYVNVPADFPQKTIIGYSCDRLLGNRGFLVIDK